MCGSEWRRLSDNHRARQKGPQTQVRAEEAPAIVKKFFTHSKNEGNRIRLYRCREKPVFFLDSLYNLRADS